MQAIIVIIFISFFFLIVQSDVKAQNLPPLELKDQTEKENLYPYIDMIKERDYELTIKDVSTDQLSDRYVPINMAKQKRGFFQRINWIRFDVENHSSKREWFLEFAFPLINELQLYVEDDTGIQKIQQMGVEYPFHQREIKHRHFVMDITIEPGELKTFYALATGSGDLHPPITIWDQKSFVEKQQKEFLLLGVFYGIVLVMILYNLFLFFSLRMKSYLYYVLTIICTLLGKLSINGLAYQYLWPDYPAWNIISTPFWVSLACIFMFIFTRNFLDTDQYFPSFKKVIYPLIFLHTLVILSLFISRYVALYLMVISALLTFIAVLGVAFICLFKGARQARFYIVGWIVFLVGVSITILERAVVLPFTLFTEYAGQAALTIEVVLLSLALADKINMMRQEKEKAEEKAAKNQALAMENLKKSDQLKDEFLAITSHELRTPLYGMIGIAESIRDGVSGMISENMRKQLTMIVTSGQRLTQLVNEILDFSKLKYDALDLAFKPVDVKAITDLVISISNPLLREKEIQLINKVPASLPAVRADENRLQQILHNLVDNAIKYTETGEVTIDTTLGDRELIIHVTDTGEGMTSEQLKLIFEPFQQGDPSLSRDVGGIGIGLNITKTLVDLHEGELHVSSVIGEGSTFSFSLPLHTTEEEVEEIAATSETTTLDIEPTLQHFPANERGNKPTIVVCDDEIVNLQVLLNQLSLSGYDVLTTPNGKDVLDLVEEHHVDLLILDIMMPGMSGYEVCQKLREKYSVMELPILMLTAKNQMQDKLISFEAGANDYLVKPCDKEELLSRVKTLVQIKLLNQEVMEMNLHLEEKVSERTHELKEAHDHLQTLEQSRRRLLANIAHELGTPVTLIHNYIQSVQQGLVDTTDVHYQGIVKDKINVLNRLIEDLFALSKNKPGEISLNIKRIRLDEWIKRLFKQCQFIISQENRQFKQGNLPSGFENYFCYVDQERTDQLFLNLISNAIKNTPAGHGEINLEVGLLGTDKLLLCVRDNGIGIPQDDLPFIFERFYRTNEDNLDNNGTGLGLAIVKQIVENHQGEIKVESVKNQGTTFSITFPIEQVRFTGKIPS